MVASMLFAILMIFCLGCHEKTPLSDPVPPGSDSQAEEMTQLEKTGSSPGVRSEGDKSASKERQDGDIQKHIMKARGTDETARVRAISVLGQKGEKDRRSADVVLTLFGELITDRNVAIRNAVVRASGNIGDSRTYRTADFQGGNHPLLSHSKLLLAIVNSLDDPERSVREAVPRSLGKIVESNFSAAELIIPQIIPLLMSQRTGTRAAAAESLRHIAGRMNKGWRTLRSSASPDLKGSAAKIPKMLLPAVPGLERLMSDTNDEVKREARAALLEINPYFVD